MTSLARASTMLVPLGDIVPSRWQPRQTFDPDALLELAASIQNLGLLVPILVFRNEDDEMELIAGERRVRAQVALSLATQVPAWIAVHGDDLNKAVKHIAEHGWMQLAPEFTHDLNQIRILARLLASTDMKKLHNIAVIENLQRENLTPIDTAQALKDLQDEHGYSQRQLAEAIGKSHGWVQQRLGLLDAAPGVQARVNTRVFTVTHARALAPLPAAVQEQIAGQVEKMMKIEGDTTATTRKVQAFAGQAKEFLKPNRWEPNGSEPLTAQARNLRALLAHLLRNTDKPILAQIVVDLKEAGDLGRKPQSINATTLSRILTHFANDLDYWSSSENVWRRLAAINSDFSCASCLWQTTHEAMDGRIEEDMVTDCRQLDGESVSTCLYYVRRGDARWPALLPINYRIHANLDDDQPGLRKLDENGRGPWFAAPEDFPGLYQTAVDKRREQDQKQEQKRNTDYLKPMRRYQKLQNDPPSYFDLNHPQAHTCQRCVWHRPGEGSSGVECHYATEPRRPKAGYQAGIPQAPDYALLVRSDGLTVPRCDEFVAQNPIRILGSESGQIALPRDATLGWFRHLLKRNSTNYHSSVLPRFLPWLTHPGDDVKRRLQRIRDLWNEASDAQVARLFSVLISTAHAASNYRLPLHLMNPTTGEIEEWADVTIRAFLANRRPYGYPNDWPAPWLTKEK